jgi:hypothetical protein
MKIWKLATAAILFCSSTSVFSAKLNVPDDFPNTFYMDLLAGNVFVGGAGSFDMFPNGEGSQIYFDATAFDNVGTGYGTSDLTLTGADDLKISDFTFFNIAGSLFVDGNGTGTLVDNGNGTGEWTLDIPLYAIWNDIRIDFSGFNLSSNASYQLGAYVYDPLTGQYINEVTGSSMSYETGDTFLVGQGVVTDTDNPFYGIEITMGVYGNDPVLSEVPVPAAVWLFGSGLIGLIGVARRKKA